MVLQPQFNKQSVLKESQLHFTRKFDKSGEAGDSRPSFVSSKLATEEAALFDGAVLKMPPHGTKE